MKIQRPSAVRPCNSGSGGRAPQRNKIRSSDLPAIAKALGIGVDDVIETGSRVQKGLDVEGQEK